MRIKDYRKRILGLRIFSDILATILAWALAFFLRFYVLPGGSGKPIELFAVLAAFACAFTLFFCNRQDLYACNEISTFAKEAGKIFKVSLYVFLLFVCVYYYLFVEKVSRLALLLFFAFHFLFLLISRRLINASFEKRFKVMGKKGLFYQRILLVGSGSSIEEYCSAVTHDDTDGRTVEGQYFGQGRTIDGIAQVRAASLKEAVSKSKADIVVISTSEMSYTDSQRILNESLDLFGQKVFLIPSIPKSYVGTELSMYRGIPIIGINSFEMSPLGRIFKRTFDVVSCSLGVLLLSPLFLFISILVKTTSKGPVFFRQKRVTRDGKVFEMLKFRSMRIDMPEGDPHLTPENDPRVTKIGKFLRKTSLDEIPQFFNVIGGSMSLIGPRPERPELEERFIKTIPGYNMRHKMKAGISGWAQVNGLRGNTSIEKRIDYDLYYIRNWSFGFDMKIVIFTFLKGFINKNAY